MRKGIFGSVIFALLISVIFSAQVYGQDKLLISLMANGTLNINGGGTFAVDSGSAVLVDSTDYTAGVGVDTASEFFTGDSVFSATNVNLCGISALSDGRLAVTALWDTTVDSTLYRKSEVFIYDPLTGGATLLVDENAWTQPTQVNVFAVHVLDNGNVLMSTQFSNRSITGIADVDLQDIVEFNPTGATIDGLAAGQGRLFLDGTLFYAGGNVNAIGMFPNGDLLLSFSANTRFTSGGTLFSYKSLVRVSGDYINGPMTPTLYYHADNTATNTDLNVVSIYLPPLPGQASDPDPADGAPGVALDADLSWTAGDYADSHDVYFSSTAGIVGGDFVTNQAGTIFTPGDWAITLTVLQTYYWRVDEVNGSGTNTGSVWSFTAQGSDPPTVATDPVPADGASNFDNNGDLSWTAGAYTDSHDLYFGTNPSPVFIGNQAGTTYELGTLAYGGTYYWSVDEINTYGRAVGAVWSFVVEAAPDPNLLYHYRFDDGDGLTVSDDSDNGHTGTLYQYNSNGYPDWTTGRVNGALDFSDPGAAGNGAAVTFDGSDMNPNAGTVALWAKRLGNDQGITFMFDTNKSGASRIAISEGFSELRGIVGGQTMFTGKDLLDNVWYYIAVTWDNGSCETYLDAVLVDTASATLSNPFNTEVRIGNTNWTVSSGENFEGIIDDVKIYDKALSPSEINYIYGKAGFPNPADGATMVDPAAVLSWTAGEGALSHEVYFGTSGSPPGVGNQSGIGYDPPGLMMPGQMYYWRVDEVHQSLVLTGDLWSFTIIPPPDAATIPGPTNGQSNIDSGQMLSWTVGAYTTAQDVYFGTTTSPGPVASLNGTENTYGPTLVGNTVYYWRVDATNSVATTTGSLWSFSTLDAQASGPSPSDGQSSGLDIYTDISWTNGFGATSHDVYFGTTLQLQTTTALNSYDPGVLDWVTTYYWRIDENSAAGTATGNTWYFVTMAAPPPGQSQIVSPTDGSENIDPYTALEWTAGIYALTHNVYFGTDMPPGLATNTAQTTYAPGGDSWQINWIDVKSFCDNWLLPGYTLIEYAQQAPGWIQLMSGSMLELDTIYYWQIDEVGEGGTTPGALWSFHTISDKPTDPNPANGAKNQNPEITFSWFAGYGATSHDIYIGTDNPPTTLDAGGLTAASYETPYLFDLDTEIFWRVVENNSSGTATGDVWSFTTGMPYQSPGLIIPDSPSDLTNVHPHLFMRGYGTDNGWADLMDSNSPNYSPGHVEIWGRLTARAKSGATFTTMTREEGKTLMATAMAYVISKDPNYGYYCQDAIVHFHNGNYDDFKRDSTDFAPEMETFTGYAMAFDAIADDLDPNGTPWLTPVQRQEAIDTIAATCELLFYEYGNGSWRNRPTHNFMAMRSGALAVGLYCLRGTADYDGSTIYADGKNLFEYGRDYCLAYYMDRVNGICDKSVLENKGARPLDAFPYEGGGYTAYQASRALVHSYVLQFNEYPNPATVLDENLSDYWQNFNLGYYSILVPETEDSNSVLSWDWANVCVYGNWHGVMQGLRYCSALNKAAGNMELAGFGEWFHQQILHSEEIGGGRDIGYWQGFEYIFYDPNITPIHPDDIGWPPYQHLNDSEFHVYRNTWDMAGPDSDKTYIFFRNSAHDGHVYWEEEHAIVDWNDLPQRDCILETSSHDGADNGHFLIYRNGYELCGTLQDDGPSDRHNCLAIDGRLQVFANLDDSRGYEIPSLADTDCIGAVDSDYGHAIDAIVGPSYHHEDLATPILTDPNSYHRYFFVMQDPMYIMVVDELESGHTIDFPVLANPTPNKISDTRYTNGNAQYELLYPATVQPTTTSFDNKFIVFTTDQPNMMFVCVPNSSPSISSSLNGSITTATIGSDTIKYDTAGSNYKLFAESSGGALFFQATNVSGAQYGVSCSSPVNMSISGKKASIYIYGTGTKTVTVTSPDGTDVWQLEAGKTIEMTTTGVNNVDPPIAEFFAAPKTGWSGYYKTELVSLSIGWITEYKWDFGDGQTSNEMAATHQYTVPGTYTVKLTVKGPGGMATRTKTDYITLKDFGDYMSQYPDYTIHWDPNDAGTDADRSDPDPNNWVAGTIGLAGREFNAALDAIEASQIFPGLDPNDPIWCGGDDPGLPNWCAICQHGGGGRILLNVPDNTTIYINWDDRLDPREPLGNSDYKRDFFGDNLIIDGQDKNITFRYNGTERCDQTENGACLRVHGNDNIATNFNWDRFPDGLHMRGGMRNLIENVDVGTICEDAMTMNGGRNECVECIIRDCAYGNSQDKVLMYNGGGDLGSAVINNVRIANGNQPIRMTGGGRLVVRNCLFTGVNSQGPRFGGEKNFLIFENNVSDNVKSGIRLTDKIRAIVRYNTFKNTIGDNGNGGGMNIFGDNYAVRAYENECINCSPYSVHAAPKGFQVDLGGGAADVFEWSSWWLSDPNESFDPNVYAIVPSVGRNIFNSSGVDIYNNMEDGTEIKAEGNFWDNSDVSSVLSNDVSGNVDVDPLGVSID